MSSSLLYFLIISLQGYEYLFIFVFIFCAVMWNRLDCMCFRPSSVEIKPEKLENPNFQEIVKVKLQELGHHILLFKYKPQAPPKAVVLYLHANTGNVLAYERFFLWLVEKMGYLVIAPEYPGYWPSEGKANKQSMLATWIYAIQYVHKHYPDLPKFYYGHSFGYAMFLEAFCKAGMPGDPKKDRIICGGSFVNAKKVGEYRVFRTIGRYLTRYLKFPEKLAQLVAIAPAKIMAFWCLSNKFNYEQYAAQITNPYFAVHCIHDPWVPCSQGIALKDTMGSTTKTLLLPSEPGLGSRHVGIRYWSSRLGNDKYGYAKKVEAAFQL